MFNDNETSKVILDKRILHEESKRKTRISTVIELKK
jgi:hypothetical protein